MRLGEFNTLTILRFTDPGAYLGDAEDNDVLLPGKYIRDEWKEGDDVEVFLYKDSEDRLVATTETPLIELRPYLIFFPSILKSTFFWLCAAVVIHS